MCQLRSGSYEEVRRYGWYRRAGAAATAVGGSHTAIALVEVKDIIRDDLQARLDELGLGAVPKPDCPADKAPDDAVQTAEDDDQTE